MADNSTETIKKQDETALVPENSVENILAEAGRDVVLKFGFVAEYLPDIAPSFFQNGKPTRRWEALVAHLGQYDDAGLLENAADVLDSVRVMMAEGNAIQIMDMIHVQMNRLRRELVGTWDGKDVFRVKSIIDAMAKANRAAQEIKDSAGFSRVARKQIGVGGQSEFERILTALDAAVAGGEETVDMTQLLIQRASVRKEIAEQGSLLGEDAARVISDESTLSAEEMNELAGM